MKATVFCYILFQDEIFIQGGRGFYNEAIMNSRDIPVVSTNDSTTRIVWKQSYIQLPFCYVGLLYDVHSTYLSAVPGVWQLYSRCCLHPNHESGECHSAQDRDHLPGRSTISASCFERGCFTRRVRGCHHAFQVGDSQTLMCKVTFCSTMAR